MSFVSTISGLSQGQVETKYKAYAAAESTLPSEDGPEEDEDDAEHDLAPAQTNECVQFIENMQTEAAMMNDVTNETISSCPCPVDPELDNMPDQEDWKKLLGSKTEGAADIDAGLLPSTLGEALDRPGDLFNSIWRLCVK